MALLEPTSVGLRPPVQQERRPAAHTHLGRAGANESRSIVGVKYNPFSRPLKFRPKMEHIKCTEIALYRTFQIAYKMN